MQKLGFTIEERSGTKVLVYANGSCHPANCDEVAMWNMIQELQKQNELYRSLQDSDSFVYMDAWPDQPWTDEEFEIVNKHNAKFAGQFRKTEEGKLEFVDRKGSTTEVKPYDGPFCGTGAQFIMPAFPEESKSFKLVKAYNDLDLPDSLLPVFYGYIKEDCYYGEYQSVEIPDSRSKVKESKDSLLFFWLIENGADYGEMVVIFYNNPSWRQEVPENLNHLVYTPSKSV